jgi:hypothetical protein
VVELVPPATQEEHRIGRHAALAKGDDAMIKISAKSGVITLINVFIVEPANQQRLIELLTEATEVARYSATQPRRGRSDVTFVTDATGVFGSDGMKTTAPNAAMFTDATEALMSRLPTRNG